MNREKPRYAALESFDSIPSNERVVIRKFSRSFSVASSFLPIEIRSDVRKLYAWCRWCDEAVDATDDLALAQARIEILQQDVERIYNGESTRHPASVWLADLVERYSIDRRYPLELLMGMSMDLAPKQPEDENELIRYSYHVAGVVGLMMCPILGARDRKAFQHAEALGIAMQLTNIARDIQEDASRGRCYLPKSWLPKGIHDSSPEEVIAAVRKLLSLSERYYRIGNDGIESLPSKSRRAIRIASAVYRDIGREIEKSGCRVLRGRTVTPWFRFLRVAMGAWFADWGNKLVQFLPSFGDFSVSNQSLNDAKYVIYLGLSLTAFTSSGAFLLVMVNPKDASYSMLPLIYSVICLVTGVIANLLAKKAESIGTPIAPPVDERSP